MPPPTKQWKKVEQQVGRFFGARRTPLSGSNSGHETMSDTLHPELYIETKYRRNHAAVVLYQSERPKADAEGKPLIIALKQHHQEGFLMVIDPRDLQRIAEIHRKGDERAWTFKSMKNPISGGRSRNSKSTSPIKGPFALAAALRHSRAVSPHSTNTAEATD